MCDWLRMQHVCRILFLHLVQKTEKLNFRFFFFLCSLLSHQKQAILDMFTCIRCTQYSCFKCACHSFDSTLNVPLTILFIFILFFSLFCCCCDCFFFLFFSFHAFSFSVHVYSLKYQTAKRAIKNRKKKN